MVRAELHVRGKEILRVGMRKTVTECRIDNSGFESRSVYIKMCTKSVKYMKIVTLHAFESSYKVNANFCYLVTETVGNVLVEFAPPRSRRLSITHFFPG